MSEFKKFDEYKLFGDKKFSDLIKDIYLNSDDNRSSIMNLVQGFKGKEGKINTFDGEVISELLGVMVKNDEHLIKLAQIIQKLISVEKRNSGFGGDDELLTKEEKEELKKLSNQTIKLANDDVEDVSKQVEEISKQVKDVHKEAK